MRHILCIVLVFSVVDCTFDQFMRVGHSSGSKTQRTTCDNSNKSTLVEQFFDVIFNEFHSNPPACVCVQMCFNQPTYCYPNGCHKKADTNKKSGMVLPVKRVNDYDNPIIIVDKKNDFMHDLLNKNNNVDEFFVQRKPRQDNVIPANLRPDPFNNRYRIFLKHKMPKLKYNIGEQMRNVRSNFLRYENFDVSNTRWPVNKVNHVRFSKQKMYTNMQKKESSTLNLPAFSEKIVTNHTSRYFKRELVNSLNINNTKEKREKQEHGKTEFDDNTYSLEQIINGLIDSGIEYNIKLNVGPKNYLEAELNETAIEISNRTSEITESIATECLITKQAVRPNPINKTTKVTSMILPNVTVDEIKYNATDNSTNQISKEVASLSKKIEIQNEMDLQMMRLVVGNDSLTTEIKETIEFITTEKTTKLIKSRQRIVRKKLHKSKNN